MNVSTRRRAVCDTPLLGGYPKNKMVAVPEHNQMNAASWKGKICDQGNTEELSHKQNLLSKQIETHLSLLFESRSEAQGNSVCVVQIFPVSYQESQFRDFALKPLNFPCLIYFDSVWTLAMKKGESTHVRTFLIWGTCTSSVFRMKHQ